MLDQLFGSRLRGRLLGFLVLHPGQRFYVRQLAGLIGEDPTNVSRELARLGALGLVRTQTEGRQRYHEIDTSLPVFPELRGLVVKTTGLVDVLRSALEPLGSRVQLAVVFGSVAAGRETKMSDVDLLVVGDSGFSEVVEALAPVQATLAREVNPVVYSAAEFREKKSGRHPFLENVLRQPKLFVIGSEHELERLGAKRLARPARAVAR